MSVPAPTAQPEAVLIVDDEQSVLDVLSLAFKRAKVPTRTALTAEAGLALLGAERFAALVTDKNLPGKSGLELIREAREKQPFLACVMITGYVSAESVVEALRLGANDYIVKPFADLMLVVQRVRQAIDNQRVAAERAALAQELRAAEKVLRKKNEEVFQHRTELDLFQSIVELRIDEATRELRERAESGEAARASAKRTFEELAQRCREAARPGASAEELRAALEALAARLAAEAEILD